MPGCYHSRRRGGVRKPAGERCSYRARQRLEPREQDGEIASMLARLAYLLLTYALVPVLLAVLTWRALTRPPYRERLVQRFGFAPRLGDGEVIWVHAVSVGEAQAAVPLVHAMQREYPDARVLITTTTPTGAAHVARRYGDEVTHAYAPYDLWDAVGRFLDRVQPTLLLVIETELWPHMLQGCRRRGIPVVLANARLTARSLRGYLRAQSLFRDALRGVFVAAQSDADAERIRELTPDPALVRTVGNLKFEVAIDDATVARGRAWRARQGAPRPLVLVGGSTHEGEERALLEARQRLGEDGIDCLLVLVPRHPERFDDVARLVQDTQGPTLVRRSRHDLAQPLASTDVLLVDAMGELTMFYAAADIAFVGGSLVRVGGHNLLEPAALGVPTLTGPHHHNAPEVAQQLVAAGAVAYVQGGEDLGATARRLVENPGAGEAMGQAGRQAVAANRGAVAAVVACARAARAVR